MNYSCEIFGSEPAGIDVVSTRMIRDEQLAIIFQLILLSMTKRVRGLAQSQRPDHHLMRNAAQGEEYTAGWQITDFLRKEVIAAIFFSRLWQVLWRYALDCVGHAAIDEPHAIIAGA